MEIGKLTCRKCGHTPKSNDSDAYSIQYRGGYCLHCRRVITGNAEGSEEKKRRLKEYEDEKRRRRR